MKELLENCKTIAVIGFSDNPSRASNGITFYLKEQGYDVYGVNPRLAGLEINGIKCFDKISSLPVEIEIFNIFRNSKYLMETVEEIINLDYKPAGIWTQLGVIDEDAKLLAASNGILYIEDECIFVEHKRLFN